MTRIERLQRRRLSNSSMRIMLSMLREAGIHPGPVLREAGLREADIARPDASITGAQELRLAEAFVERTRDLPGFWLETGFRYRLLSYGPYGLAILNARTVARALEFGVRFHELTFTLIEYSLLRDAAGEVIGIDFEEGAVPPHLRAFMVERDLAAMRRLLDDMIGGRFPIREFRVTIPAPADPTAAARALDAPVRFVARRTQAIFAPRWRDLSMPYGNPLLEETYERQCQELLGSLAVRSSSVERVVDLLVRCRGQWPRIEEAAGQLGTSARTLRRYLEEQRTSYRLLLEGVRRKQAEELLSAPGLTVEQIADCLGYAETASFTHAFKRWTGCSPREFRTRRLSRVG